MTDGICVKWPTRSRPRLFMEQFPRWDVPGVRFVVSIDGDDPAKGAYLDFLAGRENVRAVVGTSQNKIHACNRDLEDERFGILCLASDDMTPQTPQWAERVRQLFAIHFPDGDGVLHLNDGRAGRALNSICVCGEKYYRRRNYLYRGLPNTTDPDDGYVSVWCDNEWQEVAEQLGRSVYVDDVIIKHDWIGSMDPSDPLHLRNESYYARDGRVFKRRKDAGFPQ